MRIETFGPALLSLLAASFCVSCGGSDGGEGRLLVQLRGEETISEGLAVGGDEGTVDYPVRYTKYLVTIGRVSLGRAGEETRSDDAVYVADMLGVGSSAADLAEFDGLASGQWERFGFETPVADAGARALAGVSDADLREMVEKGLTYWIEGIVERPGQPVSFSFQVATPTAYTECESDGEPGVAVPEGGRGAVSVTLHGDHLWFDSFLTGAEATVTRRAQWLVDADVDQDGHVSTEELARAPAATVFQGYDLGGAPAPIENALDFVRAQLGTQGHIQGEGECSWSPR